MDILAIGNSFSDDATAKLHDCAKSMGLNINAENLFIPGCQLDRHYRNMLTDAKDYMFWFNGTNLMHDISIKEALSDRSWDVVTLQQASHKSANYESYQPYLNELADYVRKFQPKAKLYIHQTWAYEDGSEKLKNQGFKTSHDMFEAIKKAYNKAYKDCKADGIIPCGQVFDTLIKNGYNCHRDTFHASLGIGRYSLSLTWIKALTGKDISNNTFSEDVTKEEIAAAISAVNSAF